MLDQPEPRQPPPEPEIPKLKLWTSLAVPPVVAAIAGAACGEDFSNNAGLFPLLVGILAFTYIFMAVVFARTVGSRYRGPSLVWLRHAYVFGQLIVCIAVFWELALSHTDDWRINTLGEYQQVCHCERCRAHA